MNQSLNDKMMQTLGLMRYQRRQAFADRGPLSDPSQGQGRVLAALKLQDGISTRDLAYVLGLHPASLNETLAKLSQGGYIEREQSPEDGRVMLVKLTDKGRQQEQGRTSPFGNVFDSLDETEQANLASYLDKINAALKDNLGLDEDFDPASFRGHGRPGGHGGGRGRRGPGEGPSERGPRGDGPRDSECECGHGHRGHGGGRGEGRAMGRPEFVDGSDFHRGGERGHDQRREGREGGGSRGRGPRHH